MAGRETKPHGGTKRELWANNGSIIQAKRGFLAPHPVLKILFRIQSPYLVCFVLANRSRKRGNFGEKNLSRIAFLMTLSTACLSFSEITMIHNLVDLANNLP